MDIKKKIETLRKEILRHNELYYVKGEPVISDGKYDELLEELKSLEEKHPEHASQISPTQTVGAQLPDKFSKVKHTSAMLSLGSVHDEKGARHFDETSRKEAGGKLDYMCEPKLDGLSIELVYQDGRFLRGSTRGDGFIGEDVTLNLKTISNIPKKLKTKNPPKRIAVRGEVMMHIDDFQALNKQQTEEGKDTFANPRNAAAGSMRQLDWRITRNRKLHAYCYRMLEYSEKMPKTHSETLNLLKSLGIEVTPNIKKCSDIDSAIKYHHKMELERDNLNYEIDGVVIKVNDLGLQQKLGMRTTNPRWAVAYKFKPRREVTRLENIVIQVGRTGTLTPVALLQPVEVGGVTVARATLHNMDQVARLGVKIGDYVKVERAGDVIPYVSNALKEKRTGGEKDFHMPKKCPSCGSKVEKEDVFYRCSAGLACPAQLTEAISHYVSKSAVDIDGFSDKTARALYEEGLIKGVADIYTLKYEDLIRLEGWKEKKTSNILKAIEASKDVTLDRFIFALGIKNVGKHIAALLASKFDELSKLTSATREELTDINEIGPEIADCIVNFFRAKKNIDVIEKLKNRGVNIQKKKKASGGKLIGKRIVFTGSLTTMTRSDAKKLIESEGAEALSSVGASTDLVVAGVKAGAKLDKARKLGIKIISEKEFRNLLKL